MAAETITTLVRMEAGAAIGRLPADASLEDKFTAAAASAKRHWLAPEEGVAFLGAVEALYLAADPADQERILEEAESLKAMNALLSGVPVDLDRVPVPVNPIGLRKIWMTCDG